jgi:glycosyltransferase involved in cell wall biosynthesis
MKKDILISFVVPAHNEEKTLKQCINPVISQIRDIREKTEIIVVNDGSTDKTREVAKKYPRSLVRLLNFTTGHSAAFSRNRGSEIARGKYLIFLDADQIIEEGFVKKLRDILISGNHDVLSMFVLPHKPRTIFQRAWAGFRNAHYCRAFIFKREIFLKLKFNENIFYIEDNELWERFTKAGYKLYDTGLKVYHIDTESWGDFLRQRKWHGKGIICWLKMKRYWPLRYFAPCFLILFLFLPISWLRIVPLISYLLFFWIYYGIKSGETINAFLWVTVDYLGRFISFYYFLKEIILHKNSQVNPK